MLLATRRFRARLRRCWNAKIFSAVLHPAPRQLVRAGARSFVELSTRTSSPSLRAHPATADELVDELSWLEQWVEPPASCG